MTIIYYIKFTTYRCILQSMTIFWCYSSLPTSAQTRRRNTKPAEFLLIFPFNNASLSGCSGRKFWLRQKGLMWGYLVSRQNKHNRWVKVDARESGNNCNLHIVGTTDGLLDEALKELCMVIFVDCTTGVNWKKALYGTLTFRIIYSYV